MDHISDMSLADYIALSTAAGLTQSDAAKAIGMTPAYLSRKKKWPDPRLRVRVRDGAGIDYIFLPRKTSKA